MTNTPTVYLGRGFQKGIYKIGFTKCLKNRILGLKTGCPGFKAIKTANVSKHFESDMHKMYAPFCIGGEWFLLNAKTLNEVKEHFNRFKNTGNHY